MRHRAFSLTELFIGMLILAITAGVFMLNMDTLGRQTAKREAERVAAYIQTCMKRADETQCGLWLNIQENYINMCTGIKYDASRIKTMQAAKNCSYTTSTKQLIYRTNQQPTPTSKYKLIDNDSVVRLNGNITVQYRITVKGADDQSCEVLIGK